MREFLIFLACWRDCEKLGSCVIVKRGNFKRDGVKFLIKRDCEFKILTWFENSPRHPKEPYKTKEPLFVIPSNTVDTVALNYGQLLCETWIVNRVTKRGSLWSHQTWFPYWYEISKLASVLALRISFWVIFCMNVFHYVCSNGLFQKKILPPMLRTLDIQGVTLS